MSIFFLQFLTIQFQGVLTSQPIKEGYHSINSMTVEKIRILGLEHEPSKVTVNRKRTQVNYSKDNNELFVGGLHLNLLNTFKVRWR